MKYDDTKLLLGQVKHELYQETAEKLANILGIRFEVMQNLQCEM